FVSGEKDLIAPLDIEPYLIAFLRATKFYPESAFQKICNMYRFRYNNPKYGANLIPSQDRNVFCHSILSALPYRDQHGRRILIAEVGKKWNVREVSLTEIARGVMLIVDAAIMEPKTQISGAIVIIDFEGLSIQHVWQFSPSVAKIILEWVQECLPCRLKAVHIINQPYLFNMLFAIFKPFIDEKLRNRIFFHGSNTSSLLQHVDAKSIPMKYGGDMKIDTDHGPELHKLLCQYSELYESEWVFANLAVSHFIIWKCCYFFLFHFTCISVFNIKKIVYPVLFHK
ncbi:hypothetical protein AAG570_001362, partial [Ranatra chinensis]